MDASDIVITVTYPLTGLRLRAAVAMTEAAPDDLANRIVAETGCSVQEYLGDVRTFTATRLDDVLARGTDPVVIPRAEMPGVAEWAAAMLGEPGPDAGGGEVIVGQAKQGGWISWEPPWPAPPVPEWEPQS